MRVKKKLLDLSNFLERGSRTLLFGGLGLIALVCAARAVGMMEIAELKTLDLLLRWRPAEATDEHVTILEITEADLQQLGTHPIPDRVLVNLLTELEAYKPATVAVDFFRDLVVMDSALENTETGQNSRQELVNYIREHPEVIVIEKIIGEPVPPPAGVPDEQVGFVDVLPDKDGFYRRSLLASPSNFDDKYHMSLTLQLASRYLALKGFELDNGIRDIFTVRFGDKELFRVKPNSGGYKNEDVGNNPILLVNFRSGEQPFDKVSLSQFMSGEVSEELFRDRIVLIGIAAISVKDYVNSAAANRSGTALFGVEFQAHAVSQIVNAILENRPILRPLPAIVEYIGIITLGLLGISLIYLKKIFPTFILIFLSLSIALIALTYSLIFTGLWIPFFPGWIVFSLNGGSALLYRIYRREQVWKIRLDERQKLIQQSYDAIHNGPLQTLKSVIRKNASEETFSAQDLTTQLSTLDDQLRDIYEFMQREHLTLEHQVYLTRNYILNLSDPLHNLLYQVYQNVLMESPEDFKHIRLRMTDFTPLDATRLRLEDKKAIIRFLEEALCNVRQHAVGVTRLTVICKQQGQENIVQVKDNGKPIQHKVQSSRRKGQGTKQAEALGRRLHGKFSRDLDSTEGTICTLIWPVSTSFSEKVWTQLLKRFSGSARQKTGIKST